LFGRGVYDHVFAIIVAAAVFVNAPEACDPTANVVGPSPPVGW
jgi:hypothetical protein